MLSLLLFDGSSCWILFVLFFKSTLVALAILWGYALTDNLSSLKDQVSRRGTNLRDVSLYDQLPLFFVILG